MKQDEIIKKALDRIRGTNDPLLDIRFHRASPNEGLQAYTKRRLIEHGKGALDKIRIYLDQNFWINLRKAMDGTQRASEYRLLYEILGKLVASRVAVCPIGTSNYLEILRQNDPESRSKTAQVMDRLCQGYALLPNDDLAHLEMSNFVLSSVIGKDRCHRNVEMAWTYPGYVLGLAHPTDTAFDPATELAIQKVLFEHTKHRTLEETIAVMDSHAQLRVLESDEAFQARQNTACAQHEHEFKTFQECFVNEVVGSIDLYDDAISHALARAWELHSGQPRSAEIERSLDDVKQRVSNMIAWAFKEGKWSSELPIFHIRCGLHAYKRFKHIPFQKGDQHDFSHARTALPYCNYFLTERRLGQMLCDDLLTMDKAYGCKIMWDPNEIVAVLGKL